MEEKELNLEDLTKVTGGDSFQGDLARVHSVNGGPIGFYHSFYAGETPYKMIPDGSLIKIRQPMVPGEVWFEGTPLENRLYDGYWALYDYCVSVIRAAEVRIEWL